MCVSMCIKDKDWERVRSREIERWRNWETEKEREREKKSEWKRERDKGRERLCEIERLRRNITNRQFSFKEIEEQDISEEKHLKNILEVIVRTASLS